MVGYEFESGPTPEEEARNNARRKKIRRRIFLGIVVFFALAAWLEPDVEDLLELCATLEQPVIYQKVEATGYYDARGGTYCGNCWTTLKENNFDYMEFAYTPLERLSSLGPPGIYRIRKEPAGSKHCDSSLDKYLGPDPAATTSPEGRWCLAMETLEARKARFGEYIERVGTAAFSPFTGTKITKKRHYFLDHKTDELLADSYTYEINKRPLLQKGRFKVVRSCHSYPTAPGGKTLHRALVIQSKGKWSYERPADVKLDL